jgi:large subunit ribosomal protein L2
MLENFDVGDLVNSVQNNPGGKAIYARAAGTFCQILEHNSDVYAKIRLPSGSQRLIPLNARATYGMIGNEEHNRKNLEKAGRSR